MSRSCRRNVGRPFDFSDQLIFNPNVERRSYTVPELKNRCTQVVAPVGNFSVSYTAEIYLNFIMPILRLATSICHRLEVTRTCHATPAFRRRLGCHRRLVAHHREMVRSSRRETR